jgi:hypothetical protein
LIEVGIKFPITGGASPKRTLSLLPLPPRVLSGWTFFPGDFAEAADPEVDGTAEPDEPEHPLRIAISISTAPIEV